MATGTRFFNCPNCKALYQIVEAEAGSESGDQDVACRVCGESRSRAAKGKFVLKYFLLRKAGRVQRWARATPDVA